MADGAVRVVDLEQLPAVLTVDEAAEVLRLNRWTVGNMCQRGELAAGRRGRTWRIPKAAVLAWLGLAKAG